MAKISRLSSSQRDDLIAYLDGELDDAQTQQVEQILAESNVARHEIDMFARTWDMLGALPSHKVSAEFTQKTLSMIAVKPPPPPLSEQAWFQHVRRGCILAGWVTAAVVAGVVGYQITNSQIPNPADQLVDELPIIEKLDQLQEAGSVEFLRELHKQRAFDHGAAQ